MFRVSGLGNKSARRQHIILSCPMAKTKRVGSLMRTYQARPTHTKQKSIRRIKIQCAKARTHTWSVSINASAGRRTPVSTAPVTKDAMRNRRRNTIIITVYCVYCILLQKQKKEISKTSHDVPRALRTRMSSAQKL